MDKELLEQLVSHLKSINYNTSNKTEIKAIADKLDALIDLNEKQIDISENILERLRDIYLQDASTEDKLDSIDKSIDRITDQLVEVQNHLSQIEKNTDRFD